MWRFRNSALLPLLAFCACGTLTIPEERRLGEKFALELRSEIELLGDPAVRDYVAGIGRDILRAMPPQPFEYQFEVVADDGINAFAAPGGYIYFNTGLLLRVDSVQQLAGVMGHEIGHVVKRHVARRYKNVRAGKMSHGVLVLGTKIFGGEKLAETVGQLGGLALVAAVNSFGRDAEREADDFAVQALPAAGYDPNGVPSFFEKLMKWQKKATGGAKPMLLDQFLSSHPSSAERIRNTRAAIEKLDESAWKRKKARDNAQLRRIQDRIRRLLRVR